MQHDALIHETRKLAAKITPAQVGDHFLTNLGSAPEEAAALLQAWSLASNLPTHDFHPSSSDQSYMCIVCGAHTDNGEVQRYLDVVKAHASLAAFVSTPPLAPGPADIERLVALLDAIASIASEDGIAKLERAMPPVLGRTNKHARHAVMEALGAASVLDTPDYPGYFSRWRGRWDQQDRPNLQAETDPPAIFWRGRDGVNRTGLDAFFPQPALDAARSRIAPRTLGPQPIDPRIGKLPRAKGQASPGKKGRAPQTELGPGDVVHIPFDDLVLSGLVWGWQPDERTGAPIVELFAGSDAAPPAIGVLKKRGMRLFGPHREPPVGRREAFAITGLELFGPVWPGALQTVKSPGDGWHPAMEGAPPRHRPVMARNLGYTLRAALAGEHVHMG